MAAGKLFGVSVGPGDPELMTLKAVHTIQKADVIAVPTTGHKSQKAYEIACGYASGKPILECDTPMTRDQPTLEAARHKACDDICSALTRGLSVAYLCLGDVSIYSSFTHLAEHVRQRGFDVENIPGVTSFCAAAAKLAVPLCQGSERLTIATADDDRLLDLLNESGTVVIMKPGHDLTPLCSQLQESHRLENAGMVVNCGQEDERVYASLGNKKAERSYFAVIVSPNR